MHIEGQRVMAELVGNEAVVWRNKPGVPSGHERLVNLPNVTRDQIVDLAFVEFPNSGNLGEEKTPYLAAAVGNQVYLVNLGGAPFIASIFTLPFDFKITQLIETRKELYVVLGAKNGEPLPPYSLFLISRPYDYGTGRYKDGLEAVCVPPSAALAELAQIYSLQQRDSFDPYFSYFAALGQTAGGAYRLVAGSPFIQ
jgi:hypothetical protein